MDKERTTCPVAERLRTAGLFFSAVLMGNLNIYCGNVRTFCRTGSEHF